MFMVSQYVTFSHVCVFTTFSHVCVVTFSYVFQALYDFQPGEQDHQPMAAWLAVMEKAHLNLAKYVCQLTITLNV